MSALPMANASPSAVTPLAFKGCGVSGNITNRLLA